MVQSTFPFGIAARAAGLGVVAGLRSQLPFALLAAAANRGRFAAATGRPIGLLRSRGALVGFGLSAAGELVGDKLPMTPSRLQPLPLAGRVLVGAAAGATLAREAGRATGFGAALGAAGGALGSFGGYHLRVAAGRATGLPDPVVAVAEDALAIGLGAASLRR